MAKGQKRSTKEQRKPKSDKKQGAKALRPHELIQQTRTTGSGTPPKK